MNKPDREKWILNLKKELMKLSDQLRGMEERAGTETMTYKDTFKNFVQKLTLYEDACKKHDALTMAETSQINENKPN